MTKLFGILFLLLICVAGVGLYRGWFSVSTQSGEAGGQKTEVNLTVDSAKAKEDTETVKKKAVQLVEDAKTEVHKLEDQAKEKFKKN